MNSKLFGKPFSLKKCTVATLCTVCVVFLVTAGCGETGRNFDGDAAEEQKASVRSTPEVWDYPLKPGMEQWRQFKSMEEMFQACQIPEDVLKTLDTESLVRICYNFPAYLIVFFYNSPQDGFNAFHSQFNGVRELMDREDAGRFMLDRYRAMTVADYNPSWSLVDKGYYAYRYKYFETLLAQPQVIRTLGADGRTELLKEAVRQLEMKLSLEDTFGGSSFMATAWVMARTLHYDNRLTSDCYSPEEIGASLESGILVNYGLLSIYEQAKSYGYE